MTTLRPNRWAAVVAAAVLTASLAGCGRDDDEGPDAGATTGSGGAQSSAKLSGTVKIDGSSTVAPLTGVAAELFADEQPGVQVPVATSGTGGGFEKFCRGETDISNASRPIKSSEAEACAKAGIAYRAFTVANDALTVVVNKENTWLDCIKIEQLKKIWEPGSTVNNWNQVDPAWPDEPLKLFGAGTDSGTFDYFTEAVNGEEGASRTDYNPAEDDNVTVTGVSGSKGGLGYFGFSYYEENADKLKALQVDGGSGCVAPSPATVQDGTYAPLARPLFIYPSAKALERPEVLAFVEYYVRNHARIAEEARFVPLNAAQEAALTDALDKLKSGAAETAPAAGTSATPSPSASASTR